MLHGIGFAPDHLDDKKFALLASKSDNLKESRQEPITWADPSP